MHGGLIYYMSGIRDASLSHHLETSRFLIPASRDFLHGKLPFPGPFPFDSRIHSDNKKLIKISFLLHERDTRIELASIAWEAIVLPLY